MALLRVPSCDRPGLFQSLRRYIQNDKGQGDWIGLILIDIKNFASLNRVFDYKYGDLVLYFIAQRLEKIAEAPDCLYRLGNDEFVLILPRLESGAQVVVEGNNILDQVRQPYQWREQEINVDVNMGCVALVAAQTSAEQLLSSAEHVLQQAKQEDRTLGYAVEPQREDQDYVWLLEQDLLRALHNNELELAFQPKIQLSNGEPVHAEALLRWRHPEKGFISPGFLIEMIVRLRREYELTKWVLHTALRRMQQWPQRWGLNGVAVNVPANIVHHPDFRQLIDDALKLWSVKPGQLTLEITEGAVIEDQQAGYHNLEYLKQRGVEISIDDFGTGYSSLQYFKSIPATELKIDQSFVFNMATNEDDRNIAQLIIDLAHRFGLKVVAEGVEYKEVLDELIALGCDYAQGFYISHPLPHDRYVEWLSDYQLMVPA